MTIFRAQVATILEYVPYKILGFSYFFN